MLNFEAEASNPAKKPPGQPSAKVDTTMVVKDMLMGHSGLVDLACTTPTGNSKEDNLRRPKICEGAG